MEDFGKEREDFLRKFLELRNGIPDSDTFRRVFEKLNPEELSECLVNWLKIELPDRCVIAVDGKTIRGSQNKEHKAYNTKNAAKQGDAEERPDAAVRYTVRSSVENMLLFLLHRYLQADKCSPSRKIQPRYAKSQNFP